MVRNDPSLLAAFLAGTGVPQAEIDDIIRTQFPAAPVHGSDQPVERKQ
jgi:hypothetical protein